MLDAGCIRMSNVWLGVLHPPGTDWLLRLLAFVPHLISQHVTSRILWLVFSISSVVVVDRSGWLFPFHLLLSLIGFCERLLKLDLDLLNFIFGNGGTG